MAGLDLPSILDNHGLLFERVIGEGATGKAVLCSQDGEWRVVKVMNMSTLNEKEQRNAHNEVKVMQQLDHPYIIKYYTSFLEDNVLYIVMEYAPGGDIQSQLDAQQKRGMYMEENQLLDWFTQLALAISHCHSKRILHRDLKPENIFLGARNEVKLGDFGLGKCLNTSAEMAKTTAGTPFYLSPEICNGKTYNRKSDIWALGCCLYKMVTYHHAFQTNTLPDLIQKIKRGAFDPIPKHYSLDLMALINYLLTSDPSARPSINEVIQNCQLLSSRVELMLSPEEIEENFGSQLSSKIVPDTSNAFDVDEGRGRGGTKKSRSPVSSRANRSNGSNRSKTNSSRGTQGTSNSDSSDSGSWSSYSSSSSSSASYSG